MSNTPCYQVARGFSVDELAKDATELAERGYRPCGPITTVTSEADDDVEYLQPMFLEAGAWIQPPAKPL